MAVDDRTWVLLLGSKNVIADQLLRICFTRYLKITTETTKKDLERAHEELLHPGENKMFNTLKPYNNDFPNLYLQCKEVVRNCKACQQEKTGYRNYGTIKGKLAATKPFEIIHVDIFGPIDTQYYVM